MTAVVVRELKKKGFYAVGGVAGLHLQVTNASARSWVLRAVVGSKRRDIGLGGYPDIGLSGARDKARELKELIRRGIDPVEQRKQARQDLIKTQLRTICFSDIAKQTHTVKTQEFKNHKHAAQWISTLETYAFPVIGKLAINEITVSDVLAVLEPIWSSKTETATRVRQRIASVFDHALASGLRTSPNPATWKGCLEPLLPSPQKLKKRQGKAHNHHPALAIDELPRFINDLKQRTGSATRALEFAILTAARTGEVRGVTWDEIDLDNRMWQLSAGRMKADRAHRVPLSDAVVELLEQLPRSKGRALIFRSAKNTELSDAALSSTIKRMHQSKVDKNEAGYIDSHVNRVVTTHGFRSTFKDWTRKNAKYPDEWSELALAHVNSDQTHAAYARDELMEERAEMMQAWADYCLLLESGHNDTK